MIAIIAILAAMLLPALNSAREHGRAAACVNNLKQISQSFHFYVDDNDGYFPQANGYSNSLVSGQRVVWFYQVTQYLTSYNGLTSGVDAIRKGIHKSGVFRCPTVAKGGYPYNGSDTYADTPLCSYAMNVWAGWRNDFYIKPSRSSNVSRKIVVTDSPMPDSPTKGNAYYIRHVSAPGNGTTMLKKQLPRRHGMKFHSTMGDGSVQAKLREMIKDANIRF